MKRLWLVVCVQVLCAQVIPERYIVELRGKPARAPFETAGARVIGTLETVANAVIVHMPDGQAARLATLPGVARVRPVRLVRPYLDRALEVHKVTGAWTALGGNSAAGAGIKIGIIDSGIAQDHPAFQDPLLSVPAGFPRANLARDLAYTNRKVIVARNYVPLATPLDSYGHGTAVAMEAAGITNTGPLGTITGVAPKAWLGSYKVYQNENPFGEDVVLQALEDAVNDGMDVINLSLGVALAQRPSDDVLVAAVERAAARGVIVCVAAGNLGGTPNTIASPATAPSVIAVGASSNDRLFAPGLVRVHDAQSYYAIPGYGRSYLPVTAPPADAGDACTPPAANSMAGRIALIARGTCTFAVKLANAQGAGAVAAVIYMTDDSPDLITMNVGTASLPAVSVDASAGAALRQRLGDTLTIQFTTSTLALNPGVVAPFSSRGPNADSGIKPDLLATGMYLYTATQRTNTNSFLYGPTGYVKQADGTSFAAPLVAGAAALIKAARPGLTAAQYRSLLVNSADAISFPIQSTGAGMLNVSAALASTVAVAPVSLSFGTGPGGASLEKELWITNLGRVEDTFSVGSGTVRIAAGATERVPVRLSAPQIVAGEYQGYLHIRGTQTPVDAIVPYWYGVPDGVPRYVSELQVPYAASSGTTQDIYFRVTDQTGLPLPAAAPAVRAIGVLGSVLGLRSEDSQSPGVFHAVVLLGDDEGPNVFQIDAGPVSHRLTILGQ
jgi:subtilisin family serine protease